MPIYEYRCKSCDHEFEQLVRAGQDEPDTCPECTEEAITRLISNTNFKLKGSGWYETDYADDDEPDEPVGEPEEAADSGDDSGAEETTADTAAE